MSQQKIKIKRYPVGLLLTEEGKRMTDELKKAKGHGSFISLFMSLLIPAYEEWQDRVAKSTPKHE